MKILKTLQGELWKAGKAGDVERAYALIDDAIPLDLRPIDVLMGLIGPMLYDIGNEWAQG